jgi:hypothetical protein
VCCFRSFEKVTHIYFCSNPQLAISKCKDAKIMSLGSKDYDTPCVANIGKSNGAPKDVCDF